MLTATQGLTPAPAPAIVTAPTTGEDFDLMDAYINMFIDFESPLIYHRWALLTATSALLRRNVHFKKGTFKVYPQVFAILLGDPATRKSTVIKYLIRFIRKSGFNAIAENATTSQQFIIDLAEGYYETLGLDVNCTTMDGLDALVDSLDTLDLTAIGAFGKVGKDNREARKQQEDKGDALSSAHTSSCFICPDEFSDFLANRPDQFLRMLTRMWDSPDDYGDRVKNAQSVRVKNPTVSLFAATDPAGFEKIFPANALQHGILTRTILVHSVPTGHKNTWMPELDSVMEKKIVDRFRDIGKLRGTMRFTDSASILVDSIYKELPPMLDTRLVKYEARRLQHLIKLSMLMSAMNLELTISSESVLRANTILMHTEHNMSEGLGELGLGRDSPLTAEVLKTIRMHDNGVALAELAKQVRMHYDKLEQLVSALEKLKISGKLVETMITKKVIVSSPFGDKTIDKETVIYIAAGDSLKRIEDSVGKWYKAGWLQEGIL